VNVDAATVRCHAAMRGWIYGASVVGRSTAKQVP
jgi:hypothetical protein